MKTRITEMFGIEHPIIQGGMHFVGFERVAHGGTFVDDLDTVFLEDRQDLHGIVPGGLDGLHAAIDDGFHIARIVRCVDDRQEGEVYTDWLVRHVAAAGNLVGKICRGTLRERRDDAETASV